MSIFTMLRGADFAAQRVRHELQSIANSQHRQSQLEHPWIGNRRRPCASMEANALAGRRARALALSGGTYRLLGVVRVGEQRPKPASRAEDVPAAEQSLADLRDDETDRARGQDGGGRGPEPQRGEAGDRAQDHTVQHEDHRRRRGEQVGKR